MNSFLTIKNESQGLFKDKGSKFLSFAFPVDSVDSAMGHIDIVRRKYFDARHVCYAYMLGYGRDTYRVNDDGEPSGTAGRPILGQINSKSLTDVLIVVVRYFGGTLLGTSGLINAYKMAALDAIENTQIVEIPIERRFTVACQYDNMNFIMRLIKDFDIKVLSQQQTTDCRFILSCRQEFVDAVSERLKGNHLISFEML
ncbi:MAG: IMPACT family protein [Bacteroidota bacterium]